MYIRGCFPQNTSTRLYILTDIQFIISPYKLHLFSNNGLNFLKMRFTYLLSAFCAALTIASPLPGVTLNDNIEARDLDIAELDRRAPQQTANYKAVVATHAGLVPGNYYVFTQTWPKGTLKAGVDMSKETAADIAKVRADLGYDHIAIVVGQVTNPKGWLKFDGTMYEMGKEKATMTSPIEIWDMDWKAPSSKPLAYVGQTTQAKANSMTSWSKYLL